MLAEIIAADLTFKTDGTQLSFTGPAEIVSRHQNDIREWKPEIMRIIAGETCGDVGDCDHCGAVLLGFPVIDGFTNRVCQHCGKWHRCIETEAKSAVCGVSLPVKTNQSELALA